MIMEILKNYEADYAQNVIKGLKAFIETDFYKDMVDKLYISNGEEYIYTYKENAPKGKYSLTNLMDMVTNIEKKYNCRLLFEDMYDFLGAYDDIDTEEKANELLKGFKLLNIDELKTL